VTPAGRARTVVAVGLALGLVLRAAAVRVAPTWGYVPDHLDNMAWATWARTHGPYAIYDMRPERVPLLLETSAGTVVQYAPHAFNHPPLAAYVSWARGALWHALDDRVRWMSAPPPPRAALEGRAPPPPLELRTVNTRLARAVDAAPALVSDAVLGLGVARLVGVLGAGTLAAAAGFALTFAAPAVVLDGTLWGQSDGWLAALLVWALAWWLAGRYTPAGAAYGLALATKPQAILFLPVLGYAFLAVRWGAGGSWPAVRRALGAVPAALGVLALAAVPFMAHDARAGTGAWRWVERAYLGTIGADEYAYTTMNAFNVWWLDFVAARPWEPGVAWWPRLDSRTRLRGGPTKDAVGAALLLVGLALSGALCAARGRFGRVSCVAFAFAALLAAFLFPTRVHERYVYYAIPFVTALAAHGRAWRGPWALVTLVCAAEMVSHLWVVPTRASFVASGAAAVAALVALGWAWGVVAWGPRARAVSERPGPASARRPRARRPSSSAG
jgi:hypothetical protein